MFNTHTPIDYTTIAMPDMSSSGPDEPNKQPDEHVPPMEVPGREQTPKHTPAKA